MRLTAKELSKINDIPELADFCKIAIKVNERGLKKDFCFRLLEGMTIVFKKHCPLVKVKVADK